MSALINVDGVSLTNNGVISMENHDGACRTGLHPGSRYGNDADPVRRDGSVIEHKRACAIAYLGKRQHRDGVFSSTGSRVFTTEFIAELSEKNRTLRYQRYPWLKTLIKLLNEGERGRSDVSGRRNVISLPAARK
jgi:hypothetical protein